MNEELRKLLEALNGWANKAELIAAIKDQAKPIYQPIFNDGHGVATAAAAADRVKLERRAADAEAAQAQATADLEKFRKEQPQVAAIDAQYKQALADKDKELATLKEQAKQDKIAARKGSALDKLRAFLNQRVDADKVNSMLTALTVAERVQLDDNLGLRVLQKGQQIPFAGSEDEQLRAFADELVAGVDPKFLLSDVDAGSGRETVGSSKSTTTGKAFYDKIREKAREKAKPAQKAPMQTLLERTGGVAQ